jgi:hypothetical protein
MKKKFHDQNCSQNQLVRLAMSWSCPDWSQKPKDPNYQLKIDFQQLL